MGEQPTGLINRLKRLAYTLLPLFIAIMVIAAVCYMFGALNNFYMATRWAADGEAGLDVAEMLIQNVNRGREWTELMLRALANAGAAGLIFWYARKHNWSGEEVAPHKSLFGHVDG